ncbi:hypothetical protein CHLRE_01g055448v5 [Chlamydomonas reinhardtii]|uniref:Uncharacterized protein n=1 Tax=Chlamydomonas reinhardtii TaxID=3055 RepID=A0A2K3E8C9_CHLRE|nr:uncharacterized protein CHLRE_01g055448v5 [Chlamydomonas reinhardtii]PNW89041.1 hypothetical protein CHLRE_01g055448v5 [Chlamydomonas reinhardtii]
MYGHTVSVVDVVRVRAGAAQQSLRAQTTRTSRQCAVLVLTAGRRPPLVHAAAYNNCLIKDWACLEQRLMSHCGGGFEGCRR